MTQIGHFATRFLTSRFEDKSLYFIAGYFNFIYFGFLPRPGHAHFGF